MSGTDAIGARSLRYGRMRDNIAALDAVLAHGAEISFGELPESFGHYGAHDEAGALILDLLESGGARRSRHSHLAGHARRTARLQSARVLPGDAPQNLAAFLAGSEGTLAIAKRIELKLARLPRSRALGVCRFASLAEALRAVPAIAALEPTAIELTDRRIMELGLGRAGCRRSRAPGDAQGRAGAGVRRVHGRQSCRQRAQIEGTRRSHGAARGMSGPSPKSSEPPCRMRPSGRAATASRGFTA